VLGCTEYELAAGLIGAALPDATLFRSAAAVAAQALRRAAAGRAGTGPHAAAPATGTVRVLLSGRPAGLPEAALRYAEGRLLADLVVDRPADDFPAEPRADREAERPVPPSSVPA
jgi:glutamate racemase